MIADADAEAEADADAKDGEGDDDESRMLEEDDADANPDAENDTNPDDAPDAKPDADADADTDDAVVSIYDFQEEGAKRLPVTLDDGEATAVVKFQGTEQKKYKWFAIGTSDNPSLAFAYTNEERKSQVD